MSEWAAWVGRRNLSDRVDAGLLARWCATLDRAAPVGGAAPQGLHWCLCLPDAPTAALGPDGHPRRDDSPDGFLPPVPLPRRMWAASKVEFLRAARGRSGRAALARAVGNAQAGRIGPSGVRGRGARDAGRWRARRARGAVDRLSRTRARRHPAAPPPLGEGRFDPAAWDAVRTVEPDAALLFRYSALTFNSHRIHYDRPYATGEEGYRGLVVHGPLTATLLLDLARRQLGDNVLERFAFRGLSPAVADEPLHLAFRRADAGYEMGAYAADGRAVMGATAG
jgi:3-methylfumaryl-CoA hydratase